MSVNMSAVASAIDGSSSPSAAKIIEAARARGVSFTASDDLYQLGPCLHVASGDFHRSVESPSNYRARKCGIRFAGMVAGAWPCAGVRLDWQLYFWHSFLLDSQSCGRRSRHSVQPGYAGQCGQSEWRCAGPPISTGGSGVCYFRCSGILELAAFLIFFKTVSLHRSQGSGKDRLEPWVWVVISASSGLMLVLIGNMAACFYLALRGASPALPHILDQRYLLLLAWGFLAPFVWGFSTKWMPVFLGLRPVRPKLLLGALMVNLAGIVLTLLGWGKEPWSSSRSSQLAFGPLRMFERARQKAKTVARTEVFSSFQRFSHIRDTPTGRVCIACVRDARIGGDHEHCDNIFGTFISSRVTCRNTRLRG